MIPLLLAFAHPVFAWLGILALVVFGLSMVWKAMKTAIVFVVLALAAWVIFFAG